MRSTFETLKTESRSGVAFERLREYLRYDLGTHKSTRMRRAGRGNSTTLLNPDVSDEHAQLLLRDYKAHCGKSFERKRLRFLTILHAITPCSISRIMSSVAEMRKQLHAVKRRRKIWALGAAEVELVNIPFLERFEQSAEDNKRKLRTVLNLCNDSAEGTLALVHCHVLVDLKDNRTETAEERLRSELSSVQLWSRAAYQIELKETFKSRSIGQNLQGIASYLTKGGNEQLRYKAGYGRDLAEDLEAKIWRAGLGRKDGGAETVEDDRGLTVGEVAFLDEVYDKLMRSRRDRRGYLV